MTKATSGEHLWDSCIETLSEASRTPYDVLNLGCKNNLKQAGVSVRKEHFVCEFVKANPVDNLTKLFIFINSLETADFRKNNVVVNLVYDNVPVMKLVKNKDDLDDLFDRLRKELASKQDGLLYGILLGNKTFSATFTTVRKSIFNGVITNYGKAKAGYLFSSILDTMLHLNWFMDTKQLKPTTKFGFVEVFGEFLDKHLADLLDKDAKEVTNGKGIYQSMFEFCDKTAKLYVSCLDLRDDVIYPLTVECIVSPNGDGVGTFVIHYPYKETVEKVQGSEFPTLGFARGIIFNLLKADAPMNYVGQVNFLKA